MAGKIKKVHRTQGEERRRHLRRYGLDEASYEQMMVEQNGVCAVCRKSETIVKHGCRDRATRLSVDHDHDTGKVRGLLCSRCNLGIGSLGDDAARLRAAADYLEKHK